MLAECVESTETVCVCVRMGMLVITVRAGLLGHSGRVPDEARKHNWSGFLLCFLGCPFPGLVRLNRGGNRVAGRFPGFVVWLGSRCLKRASSAWVHGAPASLLRRPRDYDSVAGGRDVIGVLSEEACRT